MHKTIIGAALGAILLAGCGGQEAPESEAPKPTTAPTRAKAPAPTVASRCLDVPAALLNSIEDGLTTNGPGSLRHGQAVKSTVTFESPGRPPQAVYMVAADIQAAGMEGPDEIGVWAVARSLTDPGLVFRADGLAKEFSDWSADNTRVEFNTTDDGVNQARECVRERW